MARYAHPRNGNGVIGEHMAPMAEPGTPRFRVVTEMIREQGRVSGFEKGRDILLDGFEDLAKTIAPYAVLKLALEYDRHALFSKMAEGKVGDVDAKEAYSGLQSYLSGATDFAPGASTPAVQSGKTNKGTHIDVDPAEVAGSKDV